MAREYQDRETLKTVYHGQEKTIEETADHFGVSWATIHRWLKRLDIQTREKSYAPMRTTQDKGYEMWYFSGNRVYVHRLLAVSEYGFEEVANKRIHHKNGIPWDNRPGDIEPLTREEHRYEHSKATGKERKAIAWAYECTDMSSYDVAETCDYTAASVRRIHEEYFG
jgi:transposase